VLTLHGAVALIGPSGAGKSTLAVSMGRAGDTLLTDDGLILQPEAEQVVGIPSYPGIRLWPDSIRSLFDVAPAVASMAHYTAKKRVQSAQANLRVSGDPVPIRRIYVLDPKEDADPRIPEIVPLSSSESVIALAMQTFHLEYRDSDLLRREFETSARIVTLTPFRRISYRRHFESLPMVRASILRDLRDREDGP
jgi:energy-coupling factor transporter ATP-binding protein EcfA2